MIKSLHPLAVICLLTLMSIFAPALVQAKEFKLIKDGAEVTLSETKAYILVRNIEGNNRLPGSPILIKRLTSAEKANYEAFKREIYNAKSQGVPYENFTPDYRGIKNTYFFNYKKTYEKEGKSRVWLAEVPAGTYVVYAQALNRSGGFCLCMGTVEFAAKAGEITDMGHFDTDFINYGKKPSAFPWINKLSEGREPYKSGVAVVGVKLTPYNTNMSIPKNINGLARDVAQYRAVGKMQNYMSMGVLRLEPIEGILAYDEDVIIDVSSGKKYR